MIILQRDYVEQDRIYNDMNYDPIRPGGISVG